MSAWKNIKSVIIVLIIGMAILFIIKHAAANKITARTVLEIISKGYFDENIVEKDMYENYVMPIEDGSIKAFFCPREECEQLMIREISRSNNIKCAFYDIDLENLTAVLKKKNAVVLIDEDNYANNFIKIEKYGLMHNKFCILDNKTIITGSMNPTHNGNTKNNNNILIIESGYLAKNYLDEFYEIKEKRKNRRVKYYKMNISGIIIENYFCPEDDCENRIIEAIKKADESIYFMTFSFTSDKIGNSIISKKELNIKGIFEKRLAKNKYSELNKMKNAGLNVSLDSNPFNMHHKVFIIDEKIVITGSMNPTRNGNENNDENIVIIYDKKIAETYLEEFRKIYSVLSGAGSSLVTT